MTNLSQLYPTIKANTVPTYNATVVYMVDNMIEYNGILYKSLTDNNTNNQPDTALTEWEEYASGGGDINAATIMKFTY